MLPALTHAALGVSVLALASAALRVASLAAPAGLERVLAAAPLAVAAAVAEALALGLLGLGGSPVALTLAALATWAAVRALAPRPALAPLAELGAWWRATPTPARVALGALAGGALAWAAWQLRHPAIGYDSEHYHLAEVVLWVQGGHPGSIHDVTPGLPVGNYPLTSEVTVEWATAIARSFVPFVLLPWLTLALTASAGWAGLRALRVAPVPRGLAVAALCSSPWLLAWQVNGSMTDPPALAWLVCAAALTLLARGRPALLAPALLAAGLSIGAKTTTAPLALLLAIVGLAGARAHLRRLRVPLLAALAGALGVGGVWYLRNLIDHGSPVWPFLAAPWGDPLPHSVELLKTTFLDRPGATVDRLGDLYLDRFGGGLLLAAAGALAPLLAPTRRVLLAAAATALGLLVWANSPVTGITAFRSLDGAVFSTTRYLLPVLATAALALALAASGRRRLGLAASALLAAVTAVNVVQTLDLGFPSAPAATTPLAGAALGGVIALAASRGAGLRAPRPAFPAAALRVVAPALALVAGALLALPARHFVARHAQTRALATADVVALLAADPGYRSDRAAVATTASYIPELAGDRLEHRIGTLSPHAPCAEVAARAHAGWLIYGAPPGGRLASPVTPCLAGVRPRQAGEAYVVFAPRP